MEDFLGQKDFHMDKKIEKLLITHANINKDEECCGLIAKQGNDTIFFPCKNYAEDKSNNFLISPDDWIEI